MQFREAALLALQDKINFFSKNFERSCQEEACGVKKKLQKTLILAYEVIVQPLVHIFDDLLQHYFYIFRPLCALSNHYYVSLYSFLKSQVLHFGEQFCYLLVSRCSKKGKIVQYQKCEWVHYRYTFFVILKCWNPYCQTPGFIIWTFWSISMASEVKVL